MRSLHSFKSSFLAALVPLLASAGCSTSPAAIESISTRTTKTDSNAESARTVSPPAPLQASGATLPPPKPSISCSRDTDLRIIEVLEASGGCWLMYTSEGIKKRVAWSKRGIVHCETVRENIRQNLESSGFECRWRDQ